MPNGNKWHDRPSQLEAKWNNMNSGLRTVHRKRKKGILTLTYLHQEENNSVLTTLLDYLVGNVTCVLFCSFTEMDFRNHALMHPVADNVAALPLCYWHQYMRDLGKWVHAQ